MNRRLREPIVFIPTIAAVVFLVIAGFVLAGPAGEAAEKQNVPGTGLNLYPTVVQHPGGDGIAPRAVPCVIASSVSGSISVSCEWAR